MTALAAEPFLPLLALLAVLVRESLWLTGLLVAANALDDLAIDALAPFAHLAARLAPRPPPPASPGRFAILVPAWDEAAVIGPMLRATLARLDHPDYRIFVGVYPNDPATAEAVAAVAREDARVTAVVTSRPGPTTKADCLNHLWRAADDESRTSGRPFRAVVLHDAEDMVDPQELAVLDRALARADMVQLPVVPLVDPGEFLVSGHYLDEFASAHARDLVVRTLLRAPVPSAGVGTAIAMHALRRLEGPARAPFDAASLTEDYELGHRLHRLGFRAVLVRERAAGRLVAVRSYFPATLPAAVRQKDRWLRGIALAGWDRLGWSGGPAARWMLLRDRKTIATAVLALATYAALGAALLWQGLALLLGLPAGAIPGVTDDPALAPLLAVLALVLAWRLLLRALFAWRVAGPVQAMLAIPRAPVGNLVNALAALRAFRLYAEEVRSGRGRPWEKTAHRFPEAAAALGEARG
ncbi:glycosyl transferase family protein [Thermaurantiacus tibetensis]|uniref:glycosyl transferase family protein n=1 Tax=Thermaurantiacus tibetensis TaxID=2759035 RepID=UPI00188E1593|nr:glycosyl transferase family protein [Thermaurantiacus tibetensis]